MNFPIFLRGDPINIFRAAFPVIIKLTLIVLLLEFSTSAPLSTLAILIVLLRSCAFPYLNYAVLDIFLIRAIRLLGPSLTIDVLGSSRTIGVPGVLHSLLVICLCAASVLFLTNTFCEVLWLAWKSVRFAIVYGRWSADIFETVEELRTLLPRERDLSGDIEVWDLEDIREAETLFY